MIVHRDTKPATEPRPLRPGDVVRDRHFPTCLSVFSHVSEGVLVFSEGDNMWPVSCIQYGLEHADGAPIDTRGLA